MTQPDAAGSGVDLARRMVLAYCDGGDREALRVINSAGSAAELGYACGYLLSALVSYAELLTGDQGRGKALAFLKDNVSLDAIAADAVTASAEQILLTEGGRDV